MARRGDLNGWWRLGLVLVGAVGRIVFRIRVIGIDRVPAAGPAIVAGNHLSALDGVVLGLVIGQHQRRMTRFLTAAEFFGKLRFGWALRLYRQIPVRRGEGDADALEEAIGTIRSGALAGIFPEGLVNRRPEDGLQRGRTGVARIALATGAVTVPVGIWGTQRRWPHKGFRWARPWRPTLVLTFGSPMAAEGDPDSADDNRRFTKLLMEHIGRQVDEARRLA